MSDRVSDKEIRDTLADISAEKRLCATEGYFTFHIVEGALCDLQEARYEIARLKEELSAARITCQDWIEQCKVEVAQREWERKKRESLAAKAMAVVEAWKASWDCAIPGGLFIQAMSALAAEIGEGGQCKG